MRKQIPHSVFALCLLTWIALIWSGLVSAAEPEGILLGNRLKVSAKGYQLNPKSGRYEAQLTLINKTKPKQTLYGPLTVVVASASRPDVAVANAEGQTLSGLPYFTVQLPSEGLKRGKAVKGIGLQFTNPGKKRFKATYAVYGFLAPYQPGNKSPAMVQLVGVSSLSGNSLTAEWIPTTDDQTPQNELVYTLHVSDTEAFIPSAATAKLTGSGIINGTIDRLTPAKRYYVKVAAMDNQGRESWSNELSLLTAQTVLKRSKAKVHIQQAQQTPQVSDNSVSYSDSKRLPKIGEYLVSAEGDGYLRKVTAAEKQGKQVTATTEPASLNEIFEDLDLNTTIKLDPVPVSAQTAAFVPRMKSSQQKTMT